MFRVLLSYVALAALVVVVVSVSAIICLTIPVITLVRPEHTVFVVALFLVCYTFFLEEMDERIAKVTRTILIFIGCVTVFSVEIILHPFVKEIMAMNIVAVLIIGSANISLELPALLEYYAEILRSKKLKEFQRIISWNEETVKDFKAGRNALVVTMGVINIIRYLFGF